MYLLGYDIGTSSTKVALVDAQSGKCVATAHYPKTEAPIKSLWPGWAEQNADSWYDYAREATRDLMVQSRIDSADIKAIGFSYQMHGLVVVDAAFRPLRDAIIWCDSRGVPYGERAFEELGAELCLERLLNSPGNFTASKLAWVKDNEPETFRRIHKVMLPADYVAWRMTGTLCTTPEGMSEYMLWDFVENAPARFLMDYFGFNKEIFPPVQPTFSFQGRLTAAAAADFGLSEGTPVTYRAGDQPNNALSLNVFNPGEVASTAGTSGVVYGINGAADYDPLSRVNCFAHVNHSASAPRIGVMTCINGTGILNAWCRRNIVADGMTYGGMNALAAQAPAGSGGISILPFGNGAERILCNREAGCSVHGINFNIHGRAHILRAAQEGIVFSFMYGMEIMQAMGMKIDKIHAGMANMFLSQVFRQTLADVSGATIELFDTDGAVGAAKGAGLGAGIYKNHDEAFASLVKLSEVVPGRDSDAVAEAYLRWKALLPPSISMT